MMILLKNLDQTINLNWKTSRLLYMDKEKRDCF